MELFLFSIFKLVAIFSAIGVVNARNPVHAVLLLVLVFSNVAAILILLHLEFMALVYLVVYIGAIAVLFLFVVMMLNIKVVELSTSVFNYLPLNVFVVFILGYQITYLVYSTFHPKDNLLLGSTFSTVTHFSSFSNLQLVGQSLFLFNFFPFFLTGLILLIAMVGSILLTLSHLSTVRRQEIFNQNSKNIASALVLVH